MLHLPPPNNRKHIRRLLPNISQRNGSNALNPQLRTFVGAKPTQTPDEEKISEALEVVAGQLGIESVTAVALAYIRQKAGNVFPIVGGRKVEHLRDNILSVFLLLK